MVCYTQTKFNSGQNKRGLFMKYLVLLCGFFNIICSAAEPTLIGGMLAKEGDFPSVIHISAGAARCTATIVGPQTILTAAHCVTDEKDISPVNAHFQVSTTVFKATCRHHPHYEGNYSFDYALCKTSSPIHIDKYASIDHQFVGLGKKVTLMGYGCVNPRDQYGAGGDEWDGRLRYGSVRVDKPAGMSWEGGPYFETKGQTALCFGDSGGPAMRYVKDPRLENHFVIGVNSRSDIKSRGYISATFVKSFQNWARDYAVANRVEICGINKKCSVETRKQSQCFWSRWKMLYHKRLFQKWEMRYDNCMAGDDVLE